MSTTYQKGTGQRTGTPKPNGQATEIAPPKTNPGLIATMAGKRNLDPEKYWAAVKATVFSGKGTNEEMIAFLAVCDHYGLEPFRGEIYAFPKKGGGIQPVVGIDGWATIINRNPMFNGVSFATEVDDKGRPVSVTCTIHRKDRDHPTVITEFFSECRRNTDPWTTCPFRMLRHKALIQCARVAFGLAGLVDHDEAERLADAGVIIIPADRLEHRPQEQRSIEHQTADQPFEPPANEVEPELEPTRQPEQREPGDEPEVKAAPTFDSFQQRIMNAVNPTAIKRVLAEAARSVPDYIDQQQLDQLSVLGQEVGGKL